MQSAHEDISITEGQEIIDGYFQASYKPVEKIIAKKQDFFELLKEVQEINIYGHSMAHVDVPYFKEIIKHLDLTQVKWRVSYYSDGEDLQKLAALLELGVPQENIAIDKLGNFDTGQLSLL